MGKFANIITNAIACNGCDATNLEREMGEIWDCTPEFVQREFDTRQVISTCFDAFDIARSAAGRSLSIKERRRICGERLAGLCDPSLQPVAVMLNRGQTEGSEAQ